jgi:catechol 2,3-dioxygenase-like lactoylglutathione lyase family enzyme
MTMTFTQPIPIFRIFDVAKAREFYLDFLGFTCDWVHQFEPDLPVYMQISRPGCLIHLSEHFGDASPGATVYLKMTGIREYNAELLAKRYRNARPGVEVEPWNALTMQIGDPFGNRIRFAEDLPPGGEKASG